MTMFDSSFLYNTLGVVVALVVCVIAFFKWKYTFWVKHGVPILSPKIPFGDFKHLFVDRQALGKVIESLYNQGKRSGLKHVGVYSIFGPLYVPIDANLTKNIIQNDFAHFVNHGFFFNEKDDPLTAHLFNLKDAKWRNMRVKLTPTFTSGKMKMMFQTLADCSHGLRDIIDECHQDKKPIDVKETLARFTTDVIGSAAFGIDCNSLKNPDTEFRKYGKKVFENQQLKGILIQTLPESLLRLFKFKITQPDVEDFFMNIVKNTVEYREKNNVFRKDFMHLLIQLKNLGRVTDDGTLKLKDGEKEEALTFNELAAQAFVFFVAGFETSSTLMTFALFELAQSQEVQTKLRNEINTILAKHNNELTYDSIREMKYLEQVLEESLRKHPPLPVLPRQCSKEYHIPELSATIPKDALLMISVLGLHHDPEHYPDPERFDPERFSEENKAKRHPCVWLPFGEGPRLCIGLRFGMLQSKVGLITLLKDYKVSLNRKTKLPMEYDKDSFILSPDGGVWLDVEKITTKV